MTPAELYRVASYPKERPPYEQDFNPILLGNWTNLLLQEALHEVEPRLVVEVGSWLGYSAMTILKAAPRCELFCLDTWLGEAGLYEASDNRAVIKNSYERFLANTWEQRDRIRPFRIDSVGGLRMIHLAGLVPDLIFIDGNHEYEGAYGDLHVSMTRFPEAVLILDDYGSQVQQAAEECCDKFGRKLILRGNAARINPAKIPVL